MCLSFGWQPTKEVCSFALPLPYGTVCLIYSKTLLCHYLLFKIMLKQFFSLDTNISNTLEVVRHVAVVYKSTLKWWFHLYESCVYVLCGVESAVKRWSWWNATRTGSQHTAAATWSLFDAVTAAPSSTTGHCRRSSTCAATCSEQHLTTLFVALQCDVLTQAIVTWECLLRHHCY